MSNPVQSILTSIKSEIATVLGPTYSELAHGITINNNSAESSTKNYSVIPLETNQTNGVTRYYTVNQIYQISLTDEFVRPEASDASKQAVSAALYDKAHEIYNRLAKYYAGLPSIVMMVSDLNISAPNFIDLKNLAVIRMNVTIRYRQSIN